MARNSTGKGTSTGNEKAIKGSQYGEGNLNSHSQALTPSSLAIAQHGVTTGDEFARLMSALMSDVILGTITPDIANSACNAGGKLLKIVEMQYRYGQQKPQGERPFILVTSK